MNIRKERKIVLAQNLEEKKDNNVLTFEEHVKGVESMVWAVGRQFRC